MNIKITLATALLVGLMSAGFAFADDGDANIVNATRECNGGSCPTSDGRTISCPTSGGPECSEGDSCICICEGSGRSTTAVNRCGKLKTSLIISTQDPSFSYEINVHP